MRFRKNRGTIPTSKNLENAALHYLSRYAASENSLRRVLENRLRRAAMLNPEFARDIEAQRRLRAAIAAIVEKYKRSGVLDDAAYAETKTVAMRRAGKSARVIRQALAHKGVARGTADAALAESAGGEPPEEAELKAALALARRRRWGPFRARKTAGADGFERRRKEFAGLARAGFSSDIARKVLGAGGETFEEETE